MTIFLENIWIWIGLAFVVGAIGYGAFLNDRQVRTLGIAVASTLALLVIGLSLYFFVDTDYKSVSRMLRGLAAAIERDDLNGVLGYIEPDASRTRGVARAHMAMIRVPSARFQDLKVVVNELTSPPVAQVSFTAVVYWKTKENIEGFGLDNPVLEMVKFDVELEKTATNSWLVTDKCDFKPRALP